MASRGVLGRDRLRRDLGPSRFEDTTSMSSIGSGKRGSNPPSRHLWVGNLPHNLMEHDLTDHFLQFGDLDTVAFQPGRSYAFVNFRNDDDAIAALKALQGFPLAGNPLRIEFAKADKSTVTPRDEDYRRDDQRSTLRGSPFSQKDSRARNTSPDPFHGDKSKTSDRNTEPSEVLWIGFPASLRVDEMILRKAFSPFGELEKITVFPGRSYAFVRFRNIISACRAKETLQGKLFGNPRVHFCFARSDSSSSNSGRAPLSPHSRSNGHLAGSESFRYGRNSGSSAAVYGLRSPHFMSNVDSESDVYGFNRKGDSYPGGSNTFDNWSFGEELGPPPDVYERRGNGPREVGPHFDDFPLKHNQKTLYSEEPWDSAEDPYLFHGAKKLKTSSFPQEEELPEYSLSDLEHEKRSFSTSFSDFSPPKNRGYTPQHDRSEHLEGPYGNYQSGPGSMLSNPAERKRFTPEPEQKPSLKLWKWEGTIAKGGTPVCHAHAFPVGKSLDMMLPEFLDCTARTGLDMLAKHYYQAASAWVVFFAPASDADIGYYNEFMHYLEEKQRAAVAKLDDKTTLFLVPPSEFSEKVLKVPGKLCISGVILRLELPSPNFGSLHHPTEKRDTNPMALHGDAPNIKPPTPSGHFSSIGGSVGRVSESYSDVRHNYPHQQLNPLPGSNWSPHDQPNISGIRNTQSQAPSIVRTAAEDSSGYYGDNKPSTPLTLPISGLQPQQLAQLASSLLGQQGQGSNQRLSAAEEIRQPNTHLDNQFRTAQSHGLQSKQMGGSEMSSMIGQLQQLQQQQQGFNVPAQQDSGNPQMQNAANTQDEGEGDPQKRLQATLQLAAALLQQIQQGKGT